MSAQFNYRKKFHTSTKQQRMRLYTRTGRSFFKPLTPTIKEQILLSCLHTFLITKTGEKLFKYQKISPWEIISLILMTSGVE